MLNFHLFCNFFEPLSQGSGVEFDKQIFTHFTNFRGCFLKGNVAKFLRFSSIVQLSCLPNRIVAKLLKIFINFSTSLNVSDRQILKINCVCTHDLGRSILGKKSLWYVIMHNNALGQGHPQNLILPVWASTYSGNMPPSEGLTYQKKLASTCVHVFLVWFS